LTYLALGMYYEDGGCQGPPMRVADLNIRAVMIVVSHHDALLNVERKIGGLSDFVGLKRICYICIARAPDDP